MSPRSTILFIVAIFSIAMIAVACGEDAETQPTPEPAAQAAPTAAPSTQASTQVSPAATQPPAAPSTQVPPAATQPPAAPSTQASPSNQSEAKPELNIVSTSNIVGDWIQRVGGERANVFSLLPPDADPHTFQPGAKDVAKIADADIVFSVGLSLEGGWLEELVENAARDHESIVSLAELAEPIEFVDIFGEDEHGHEDEGGGEHVSATGRLLVTDANEPHISVVDLTNDKVSDHAFEFHAPVSSVYSSPNHRFGYALIRGEGDNDDRVHIFDGGIYLVEHGDHHDLVKRSISMLELGTDDERPIHFANAGEWTAIFHDGTGRVALLNEHEMEESKNEYEIAYLNTGLQHGAAVPIPGDLFAVSVANPDYPDKTESSLPIGVEARDLSDNIVYDGSSDSCPGLHGEAHSHDGVAFGCVGGVLFIEAHDGELDHWFIENPADMKAESRIGTVYGHDESDTLFGRASYRDENGFADDGIWLIDPEGRMMTQALPATDDKRSVGAAFSHDGQSLYVLTYGGTLNVLDAHDGEVVAEAPLLDGFDPEAPPSFIVVGEAIYVADPSSEHVIEFSVEHMEIEREWEVHGAPNRVAFLGMLSGEDDHDDHGHMDEDGHEDEGEDAHHDHDHGSHDPHFWFDPLRVQSAVNEIASRLSALDPDSADYYSSNADSYIRELAELHTWIENRVEAVPEEDRLLVTSHDSFQYFAARYGFEVVGAILPLTTETEPSAKDLAALVETIEHKGARVVFGENIHSNRLAQRVAEETGAEIVGSLYTGSLGAADGEAGNYLDMMRFNVNTIVEALK